MSQLLQSYQFHTRFVCLLGLLFFGATVLTIASLVSPRLNLMDVRAGELVITIDKAINVVKQFHQLRADGRLTEDQAK